MTVMVTGAGGVVGRAVVKALLARDEVRATVRRPVAAEYLRQLGAKVAVREVDRPDALAELLPRCHTLVHLIGGPNQPDADALFAANHGSVLTALAAAREAGTERFVFLSVPGADPGATQPFLRAKGLAEEAISGSGLSYVIVRATHVYGLGGLWFTAGVEGALAEPPFVCGDGRQEIAPVFADDVGAVVAAIDDAASVASGSWGLEGPDALTADGFARLLRDDDLPIAHADGQAAAELLSRTLGIHVDAVAASWFGLPSRADAPDAAEAFGVRTTPLLDGLRITLAAAADLDTG
ncbi:MAG TPA: NAD(P)H-binding protein [Actinomycetota bacterium]|nr:NAD(P)H-binding protein [Actinomycetota bacterium]